jgi:hypothetical protein
VLADVACPPGLKDSILVCWGTLVVSLAPDEVPDGRDEDDGGENNGRVVNRGRGDGKIGGHAEERGRKGGPS